MKKLLLATLLSLVGLHAIAADYYIVVPIKGKVAAALPSVDIQLASSSLPSGKVGAAYSYAFQQNLQVTGDSAFTGAGVKWAVVDGSLPPGLSIDTSSGALSGMPTTEGNWPFSLGA